MSKPTYPRFTRSPAAPALRRLSPSRHVPRGRGGGLAVRSRWSGLLAVMLVATAFWFIQPVGGRASAPPSGAEAPILSDRGARPDATSFQASSLFTTEMPYDKVLGAFHRPAPDAYDQLRPHQLIVLRQFELRPDHHVDLELERFHIHPVHARFVIGTAEGDVPTAPPALALFRGRVAGRPDSRVVLGVSPERSYGFIQVDKKEAYWIEPPGPDQAGMPHHLFEHFTYDRRTFASDGVPPPPFTCGVVNRSGKPERAAQTRSPQELGKTGAGYPWRVATLALEGDWEFRKKFSSHTDALEYMLLLTAVTSSLYEHDMQIKLWITYARVWDTQDDPYSATETFDAVDEFSEYWAANMTHVDRNMAFLVTNNRWAEPPGAADRGGICDPLNHFNYGVGAMYGSYTSPFTRPVHRDLYIFAHELGHLFGSEHTHCYDPPIDTCAGRDHDCPNHDKVCQVGTIMSYCSLCPGAMQNIRWEFHERVVEYIRNFIHDLCLGYGLDICYVDGASTEALEDGSAAYPFKTVRQGVRNVMPGGRVLIKPGTYDETFTPEHDMLFHPMQLERWGASGEVLIGD